MIRQYVGVESGTVVEVACHFCLVCEMVLELEREADVSGAESTDEVVFEGLDGLFHCVDAVIVGIKKMNDAVAGGDNFFNDDRGLIVCDIEGGRKYLCWVTMIFGKYLCWCVDFLDGAAYVPWLWRGTWGGVCEWSRRRGMGMCHKIPNVWPEGLNWWADKGLVHVFYPVLYICVIVWTL
jgi:hypothetical protein